MKKKVIGIHVNEEERISLLTAFSRLEELNMKIDSRPGEIKIRLYGERDQLKQASYLIKKIVENARKKKLADKNGFYTYVWNDIFKECKRTVSPKLVTNVLRRLGHLAYSHGNILKSNIPEEELVDVCIELSYLMDESSKISSSKPLAEILTEISFFTEFDPREIAETGCKIGVFRVIDESRFELATDKKIAIEKIMNALGGF
ncbi:MAG: DUF2067 family protein [Candidatus Hydrothermarchaeota archaeon]